MRLLRCAVLNSMKLKPRVVDCEPCRSSVEEIQSVTRLRAMSIIQDRQKIEKTTNKLTLTIYLCTLKCLLGRLPILVYFLIKTSSLMEKNMVDSYFFKNEFYPVACFCINFSYSISFFFFYYSNTKFRKTANVYKSIISAKARCAC